MASKLSEGLGEQVTCPICLDHYSDPRLLPCLHTYCRHCLEDLLAKGTSKDYLVCPECRERVQIISGAVANLKANFLINNLLSLFAIHSVVEEKDGQTELTCENCDSKEAAKGRCVNCCMFLCNFCSTAHQRFLATKDHQLMTLDELKDKGIPVIEKQLFCTKHKGEVMKLYCNTCQELICRDCTIIDHRDHKFRFIEDVADEHKDRLKQEITRATNMMNEIEAVLKSVQEMKENVEKTTQATEKEVDDFIVNKIKALKEKRITLKKDTRRIAAEKMKELAAQEDGLTLHMTGLKSAIEFTEKVLNNGGNNDVLSMAKQVTSRLSQLSEREYNKNPCQEGGVKLKVDEQMFNDCIQHHVNPVDTYLPDPKQSFIELLFNQRFVKIQADRPITARHGQVLRFFVYVCNSFGDKLRFMEERIKAKVHQNIGHSFLFGAKQANNVTTKIQNIEVQTVEDNIYSFEFCFDAMIAVEVDVTIDGGMIQGCPIQINRDTGLNTSFSSFG